MEITGISVGAIVVLCYLITEGIKHTKLDNKWLPVISGACGVLLGVLGMHVMPDFPANDILTAMAIGAISGLGATGANQIYKQLKNNSNSTGLGD